MGDITMIWYSLVKGVPWGAQGPVSTQVGVDGVGTGISGVPAWVAEGNSSPLHGARS